jgi:hypothetical protein
MGEDTTLRHSDLPAALKWTGTRLERRRTTPGSSPRSSRSLALRRGRRSPTKRNGRLPEPRREAQEEEETPTASSGGTTSLPPMGPPLFCLPVYLRPTPTIPPQRRRGRKGKRKRNTKGKSIGSTRFNRRVRQQRIHWDGKRPRIFQPVFLLFLRRLFLRDPL